MLKRGRAIFRMLRRLLILVKSWFGIGLDKLENPNMLLDQARREMEEIHARNRELAIQAINEKNRLQKKLDDLKKKNGSEAELAGTLTELEKAIEVAEIVKQHIQREQEEIRKLVAEVLR